jgi:hypothetical protein
MAPRDPEHLHDQSEIERKDEDLLAELGYKQELNRDWSVLQNFGVSFSIIVCALSSRILVGLPG